MLQHLVGGASLAGVELQTALQEVEELWGPLVGVVYGGRGGGVDHQQRLRLILTPGAHAERGLAVVGRLAVGHLQRGDAQRPDVHAAVVGRAADELGRHPEGRAHHGLAAVLLLREPHGEAEVGELDLPLRVHQHVVRLDVAVQLVVVVQVRQRRQHVLAHVCDVRLGKVDVRTQDLRQAPRVHQLHRDLRLTPARLPHPQLVVPQVAIADRHDVLLVAHALQGQLVLQVLQIGCGRDLQGNSLPGN